MSEWEKAPSTGADYDDREKLNITIGSSVEGTVVRISQARPSQFGGEYRFVDLDLVDGRQASFGASKILLERIESLRPVPGDRLRITVGEATSKGGRKYALPEVYIARADGEAASSEAEQPAEGDAPLF